MNSFPSLLHTPPTEVNRPGMKATLESHPSRYPDVVLRMLLAAAERWQCAPGEAEARILRMMAAAGVGAAWNSLAEVEGADVGAMRDELEGEQ